MIEQETVQTRNSGVGLEVPRRFSTPGKNPLDTIEYEMRTSKIKEPDGSVVFEMKDVEVPKTWSQLATDILVSKYFRKKGVPGTGHETSARQVVHRIANTIRKIGEQYRYFKNKEAADAFEAELSFMLITQRGAFNSPVWFNCGLYHQYGIKGSGGNFYWNPKTDSIEATADAYSSPQCSACFIQAVEDDLMSMFDLVKYEAKLFKYGSGTGTNFSKIRGKQEKLSGGGTSSGLISFLEVFDRGAGATKSGGTTRRAAKMVCLDMDHPEIVDFIEWKVREEKKARILIEYGGFPADFNGEAYRTVSGQNSNNSVRLTDAFMEAVEKDGSWQTRMRTTGDVCETFRARDLMKKVCHSAWVCADPGVQFDDIINDWHTCSSSDRIYASNPCSEYHFLDNTACNLASINIMKFLNADNSLNIAEYQHACRVFFIAQEILVDFASYPTEKIAKNSHDYRPLGLGYANLGTFLMVNGIPYDSEKSFAVTGAITAIMCGTAYKTSAEMAGVIGPFQGFYKNRASMLRVMNKHRDAAYHIDVRYCPKDLLDAAREDWDEAVRLGEMNGYRNAQATVIAPTGTIGLLMDCDTTGIEPEFSIVKWKKLAGGGYFKIINQSIPRALKHLGYNEKQITEMINYVLGHGTLDNAPHVNPEALKNLGYTDVQIKEAQQAVSLSKNLDEWTAHIDPATLKAKGLTESQVEQAKIYIAGAQTLEGAPHIKDEHLAVFDCANRCGIGDRFIDPMGHIKIMGAAQPFISGAISKTVNLPNEATEEDIERIYFDAWKMGLKCVALYRDGCKMSQPLSTGAKKKEAVKDSATLEVTDEKEALLIGLPRGAKEYMPKKRAGDTYEVKIGGHKVYLRTSVYPDGRLGELFIDMHKEGAAYRSMMNCFAMAVSIGLQHGVPLEKYVESFTFTRFEPNGMTDHPNIKTCTSVVDFIFRLVGMEHLNRTDFVHVKPKALDEVEITVPSSEKGPMTVPKPVLGEDAQLSKHLSEMMGDAPACSTCGHITVRNGSCYKCLNCGNSMGCS